MTQHHWIIVGLLILFSCAACTEQPSPAASAPEENSQAAASEDNSQEESGDSWREQRLATGKKAYELACASCHDEGLDGAPAIGNKEAWSDRSPLWSAVLFEHSKTGFLKMPARGDHEELTDQSVEAAGEYMLSVTFPEMPLD
jgi:cytochrome c5